MTDPFLLDPFLLDVCGILACAMKSKAERAAFIGEALDRLYPEADARRGRTPDPFRLLVAVVLSAQCTDQRVFETIPTLFRLADTPHKMSLLATAEIERVIRPCGLSNNKAKAISRFSEIIDTQYRGRVPRTFEALEALPGVGHKTASVVMAQAFGQPAFPVDTHIHRLARRWRLSSGKSVIQTEKDLKKLWPPDEWHKRHLQIIYYGREHCTARGCDGTVCPLCRALFPSRRSPRKR